VLEQRFDLGPQGGVIATGVGDETRALLRRQVHDLREYAPHALPAVLIHRPAPNSTGPQIT